MHYTCVHTILLQVFSLNCSKTGYQSNFYLYGGSRAPLPEGVSATCAPVHRLTNHRQYKDIGHVLWVDNWFNSMDHLQLCLDRGIHCAGTVKSNRVGADGKPYIMPKKPGRIDRGTCHVYKHPERDCYLTGWMDSKGVNLLSTFNISTMHNCRRRSKNGVNELITRPNIIELYNGNMGGTDLMDQYLQYYKSKVRGHKWPIRVLIHFIHVAAINSHILFKVYHRLVRGTTNHDLLSFMKSLYTGLISGYDISVQEGFQNALVLGMRRRCSGLYDDARRLSGHHFPTRNPQSANSDSRHPCAYCQARTTTHCGNCCVYLCITTSSVNSCFTLFHTGHRPPGM